MSRELEHWELELIYEVTQRSDAKTLIEQKNKTLFDMDRTRTPSSKQPTPAPKPKGDIRITKTDKTETISKEDNENRKQQVEKDYNRQIKEEILKTAHEKEYEDYTIEQIKDMPEKDLSVLAEKGVDGYKEYQKQQELEKQNNSIDKEPPKDEREKGFDDNKQDIQQEIDQRKDDLDITMDEQQSRELFGDRDPDQKEKPIEDKDKSPDKNIDADIKMDEKKSEKTFDNSDKFEFEFEKEERTKNPERNKTPDPSDDFE